MYAKKQRREDGANHTARCGLVWWLCGGCNPCCLWYGCASTSFPSITGKQQHPHHIPSAVGHTGLAVGDGNAGMAAATQPPTHSVRLNTPAATAGRTSLPHAVHTAP
eukprot:1158325-Pelagomonas_calceolata.AAC.10